MSKDMPTQPQERDIAQDWIDDCKRWHGTVLTGRHAHWCYDWDFLPIDETTPEWQSCNCGIAGR